MPAAAAAAADQLQYDVSSCYSTHGGITVVDGKQDKLSVVMQTDAVYAVAARTGTTGGNDHVRLSEVR